MLGRITKFVTDKLLMWAAKKLAPRLGKALVEELDDMFHAAQATDHTQADDFGVMVLRGIIDPDVRPLKTSQALDALGEEMELRVKRSEGKLDDALVVLVRGALNC